MTDFDQDTRARVLAQEAMPAALSGGGRYDVVGGRVYCYGTIAASAQQAAGSAPLTASFPVAAFPAGRWSDNHPLWAVFGATDAAAQRTVGVFFDSDSGSLYMFAQADVRSVCLNGVSWTI